MPLTPWVRRLLIANVAVFLVAGAVPALYTAFVLYPPWILVRPWTLVTYMFLHGGFGHLFFNMLGLFFFGPRLEGRLGGRDFLWLFFLSGIGGALFSIVFASQYPVVGASGGVYGVLLAYAMFWPKDRILLFPIPVPMPVGVVVAGYVLLSLYSGITGSQSGIAHFAHLGGLAFAFAFIKWRDWKRGSGKRKFQKAMNPQATKPGVVGDRKATARWMGIDVDGLHQLNRDEVVRLLTKVQADGPQSLTDAEREFLDRMSAG